MKIVSVVIGPMPEKITDPMPKVTATFENGSEKVLFDYFCDEISFTPKEFVGLTEEESHQLKSKKDREFLRS